MLVRASSGSGGGGGSADLANLEVIDSINGRQYKYAVTDVDAGTVYVLLRFTSAQTAGAKISISSASEVYGLCGFDGSGNFISKDGANYSTYSYSSGYITYNLSPHSAYNYVTLCKMT